MPNCYERVNVFTQNPDDLFSRKFHPENLLTNLDVYFKRYKSIKSTLQILSFKLPHY